MIDTSFLFLLAIYKRLQSKINSCSLIRIYANIRFLPVAQISFFYDFPRFSPLEPPTYLLTALFITWSGQSQLLPLHQHIPYLNTRYNSFFLASHLFLNQNPIYFLHPVKYLPFRLLCWDHMWSTIICPFIVSTHIILILSTTQNISQSSTQVLTLSW